MLSRGKEVQPNDPAANPVGLACEVSWLEQAEEWPRGDGPRGLEIERVLAFAAFAVGDPDPLCRCGGVLPHRGFQCDRIGLGGGPRSFEEGPVMNAHILVEGRIECSESLARIREAGSKGQRMWVEIGEHSVEAEALLVETFHLHPLIVEDIFGERSVPKIEEMDGYLYVVVHALRPSSGPPAELGVLDIVIGDSFVLTQHREGPASAHMRAVLARSPELLERGVEWVAHAFMDRIVDRFLPYMDDLRTRIEAAEGRIMLAPREQRNLLPELAALKRSIDPLCRIAPHQGDILRRLSRDVYPQISREARPYFRDVCDHFARVAETAENSKGVITNAIDAHLNVQSYRLNDTVKRLTLISTVMLPLNLIASFYGMNFTSLPGLTSRWGFVWVIGLMLTTTLGVTAYFRFRKWT